MATCLECRRVWILARMVDKRPMRTDRRCVSSNSFLSPPHSSSPFSARRLVMADVQTADANANALTSLLTNPIFVQALANAASSSAPMQNQAASTSDPHGFATQLQHGNTSSTSTLGAYGGAAPPTPYQQTRSGRISRPPVAPQYSLLQTLAAQFGTPNFDSLLKEVSSTSTNANNASASPVIGVDSNESSAQGNGNDYGSSKDGGNYYDSVDSEGEVPLWPLPPSGPGSRAAMSKEEIQARRKARNRMSGE